MSILSRCKCLLAGLALVFTSILSAQEKTYIDPSSVGGDGPVFSGAVMRGDTLYLSGMIGLDNGQVPATAEAEARLLLDQFKEALAQADMTMDDLLTVTIYCSDVAHYDAFNAVYSTYFSDIYPARAFIGAGTLLFNARFEMQGIAAK
jgi:2-iminobutanoate/2-iminopropanoate deaminase